MVSRGTFLSPAHIRLLKKQSCCWSLIRCSPACPARSDDRYTPQDCLVLVQEPIDGDGFFSQACPGRRTQTKRAQATAGTVPELHDIVASSTGRNNNVFKRLKLHRHHVQVPGELVSNEDVHRQPNHAITIASWFMNCRGGFLTTIQALINIKNYSVRQWAQHSGRHSFA